MSIRLCVAHINKVVVSTRKLFTPSETSVPELIQVPTDGVVPGYVGAVVPFVAIVRFFTTHKSTITLYCLIKPTDSSLKGVTAEAGAIEDTKPCPKDKACYRLIRKC